MKFIADTHAHTLASGHAYSTIREMAAAGAEKGLQILALTEHAPEMPGTCQLYYFQNLDVVPREINGLHMLFGTELNIMDSEGNVDLPEKLCKELDIVVASMHSPCFKEEPTIEAVTKAYVETMKKPYVNIIGHPDDGRFPIDYEILVKAAKETKTLLELNNSSLRSQSFRQGAQENMLMLLDLCKQYEVPVTTGSDAHVDVDAGNFSNIEKILEHCDFPKELIVTTDFEKLKPYLNLYKRWTL
ncbi:phosphatase [Muricomes intestini]|jgi:putative hydrolase|uniref:Putative hydrolase n=1 Tax=Muricomes intestini TaxID=1796634 RepID=A0A4R3KAU9_9FIRM|nr:phosphatase [Muricomes intestini]TCS80244.1 putative hydrolase [Muricomes intestini]HAX52983.1 phosphatase [Lachnospiraceae bacterium]HCR81938.1 phosphatase [Lachnospiraceae bacterium]